VNAPDGTSWTWALTSSTIIIGAGHQVGAGTLSAGEQVIVLGQVTGGTDDARRVFVIG